LGKEKDQVRRVMTDDVILIEKKGVQHHLPLPENWVSIYDKPYSDNTGSSVKKEDLAAKGSEFDHLLVGAYDENKKLILFAIAPPDIVFRKTDSNNTTSHNGVEWYFRPGSSSKW
jgi:hypothetical protein